MQTPDHILDLAAAGKSLRAAVNRGTDVNGVEKATEDEAIAAVSPYDETRVLCGVAEENSGSNGMSQSGLEPETYGLKVRCSTD